MAYEIAAAMGGFNFIQTQFVFHLRKQISSLREQGFHDNIAFFCLLIAKTVGVPHFLLKSYNTTRTKSKEEASASSF